MAQPEVGSKAPDFSLLNQDGETVGLSDFSGKALVIYFYPKDNTPGCKREAEGFGRLYRDISGTGAEVIGISRDSVASHKKFSEALGLPFDLLSDPGLAVLKDYGAWGRKVMYGKETEGTIRSTVIVGVDGRVKAAFPKVSPDGHPEKVLEMLRKGI